MKRRINLQCKEWWGFGNGYLDGCQIRRDGGIEDADVLIVDTRQVFAEGIDKGNLRGIVRVGVGYDNIPLDVCRERGIVVAYTPNAPSQSVAEHTLALMLHGLRRLSRVTRDDIIPDLRGLSVGVIGLGRIGKRFAAMCRDLGCIVRAFDPYRDTTFDHVHNIIRLDFDDVLMSSDVVSLHVPRTARTVGMIGTEELAIMGRRSILINTSRGGIVNEAALYEHANSTPGFFAGLDVFNLEPYRGPLLGCENVLCTPHVASRSELARKLMECEACLAARAILQGEDPQWLVPDVEPWAAAVEEYYRNTDSDT